MLARASKEAEGKAATRKLLLLSADLRVANGDAAVPASHPSARSMRCPRDDAMLWRYMQRVRGVDVREREASSERDGRCLTEMGEVCENVRSLRDRDGCELVRCATAESCVDVREMYAMQCLRDIGDVREMYAISDAILQSLCPRNAISERDAISRDARCDLRDQCGARG